MAITVLLADDHPVFRKGLSFLLAEETDIDVVGEAEDGQAAIEMAQTVAPDVVVMDISMPTMDGIEATQGVLAASPDTKVMALSIHGEKRFVENMLRAGATGYMLKESAPEELVAGIRAVYQGEIYLSAAITDVVVNQYRTLLTEGVELESTRSVTDSILVSKLFRPQLPPGTVPRPRLLAHLDGWRQWPLTLVSAPAGYGKSMLVIQWLAARTHISAWISLDEDDNDLTIFLTYWVEAIERLFPDSLPESASLLAANPLPPPSVLTTTLVNEMAQIEDDFVLVLEDYHQIVTPAIHALLRDILRHPPAPLHLILVTRVDPPLDLMQMRARSRMGEIRANALRFTVDETSAFLDKALDVRVEDAVSVALTARTEGWIAGMYLIALAAENPADLADGSTALPGEHQTLDYLVAEAVARQPRMLQTFLLKTSILSRFNVSLCDAIGAPFDDGERPELSGADFIRWLEERNLFVVPLDPHSQWFRYHTLFQDLLQSQLAKMFSTAQIKILHARACDWFLARGMADDAFDHALQAGDFERAIQIVDVYRYAEFDADRGHIVERWLDRLPPNVLAERPGLLLANAWAHNHRNQMARIPSLLAQVDALLVGETVGPVLLAELNFLRGNLQYWSGEGEESVRSLEAASAQLEASSAQPAGGRQQIEYNVELLLALARCMVGRSEDAIRRLGDRIRHAESIEGQYKTHLMGAVAIIHLIDGDLSKARAQAERLHVEATARQFANNDAWSAYLRGCADLHAFDLDSAANHFAAAIERRYMMHRGGAVDAMAGMVLTQQLRKLESEATQALELLFEFAHETNDANALAVAQSCQARLCLLRGDLTMPMQWVQTVGEMQISPVPFIWLEVPGITVCRALIGSGIAANLALAEQRLHKMRRLYEINHFVGQTIEVIVLQSLALARQERTDEALDAVSDALALAMPGGWLRPFVEAGPSMVKLLNRLPRQEISNELMPLIGKILSAQPDPIVHADSPGLLEPLTAREEEIVRLLATELSAKGIADYLVVSVATVRAHIRSIYSKMDVHGRAEAVQRANDLGIL